MPVKAGTMMMAMTMVMAIRTVLDVMMRRIRVEAFNGGDGDDDPLSRTSFPK